MKKRTPVSKIMTSDLVTVNVKQSLKEVDQVIKDKKIHHVPVVSGNDIVGLISKTDLQKISFVNTMDGEGLTTAMYDSLSIEQVMTKNLKTIKEEDTILEAAQILSQHEFHALPVVNENGLAGIVTSTDLIKYLIEQY